MNNIGEISEAIVLARLVAKGKTVLLPWGNNERFDLVIYENREFIRIQVKTGRYKNGVITFSTSSTNYERGKIVSHPYWGQIDLFLVYVPELDKIYSLDVKDSPKKVCTLRLVPSKNNQVSRTRIAEEYPINE